MERGLYRRVRSPYWWMRYRDASGRYVRESTGCTLLSEARALLASRRCARRPERARFADLARRYGVVHREAPSWRASRRWVVDALVVRWGGLDVAQVTPYVVQQWVADEAARGQAPATVQRNLGTVKAIMAAGAAWGMVTQDHLAAIRAVPGPRVAQRVPRYLSHAEAGALIAACRGRVRLLVVLALATGCRYAELMALRWDQVGDGVLHVRQSLKGGRGRDVPLDEATMRELERWRDGGEWVFASTYKRRGHADSLTRGWDEARKESGVRCRFHDLRHTAASWLVMDGVPLYVVQALLGHGSQRMTERYAHLSPTHPMQVLRSVSRAHLWHTAPKRKGKKKAPGSAPGA